MKRLFCLLGCLALIGCGGGSEVVPSGQPARQVRVDWLGYESFMLTSIYGTKILTNPFSDGTAGRSFPKDLRPSVILVTNEDSKVNNVDAMDNMPTVFRAAVAVGSNTSNGIRFRGVPAYPNPEVEAADNMNVIFGWTQDGLRFCFLGNLPNALTSAQLAQLGTVDVLFLPSGVPAGLSDSERQTLISQLQPRVIIPMGLTGQFGGWAGSMPVHRLPGRSVLLSRDTLPATPTVLVFEG